jgi:hypothetical protein
VAKRLRKKRESLGSGGKVYFTDAMHLLHNAVPGQGWIKTGETVELKTNSGRNRLNILGAYSPDDTSLVSIESVQSCDAPMACELLKKVREANPGRPLMMVLDNASYYIAGATKKMARRLRITLLYLPTYSPNLNLIERFWKFLRKKVVRNKYGLVRRFGHDVVTRA